jgi:hypothetical protein
MALYRHLVVDVTVTSACTDTNVPRVGACFLLPGSLALGAQHGKLDVVLGTPSVQSVHDYYPFSVEDDGAGWRLWWLIDGFHRLDILVEIRRFHCMGVSDSRTLYFDSYVLIHHFVRRSAYIPFRRRCLGDVRR